MANLITGCCLDFRHFEMIFQVGMNFIDSVARGWVGGWVARRQVHGGAGVGERGGKTNLYRLFGVAVMSRSIHTEPRLCH